MRESVAMPLYRPVERLGLDPVEFGQVGIKQHLEPITSGNARCAGTILAQGAKQGPPLRPTKQGTCDKAMGQNSRQPEGLQPESALALSLGLPILGILAAPRFALSPILAATHACFLML